MKRTIAGFSALIGGLMLTGCADNGYGYGGGGYGIYSSGAYPRYYDGYYNGYYRGQPRGDYRRDYHRRDNHGVRDRGRWEGRGHDSGWRQRNENWNRDRSGRRR